MNSKQIVGNKLDSVALVEKEITMPGRGEVQVRLISSVVSPGTERAFIRQMENTVPIWPFPAGYSAAGIVEAVGEGVSKFTVGDRVAGKMIHSNIVNVEEELLFSMPDKVDFDEASYIIMGHIAMQAIRKARIELGEACVIFGAGLVGLVAAQFAKANGACPVIQIDQVESKLERALTGGADYVINSKDEDWKEQIKKITNKKGVPVIIESTGFPQPIVDSLQIAANYGRVIILSSTRGNPEINFYRDVHKKGITIIGAHASTCPSNDSYPGFWTQKDNCKTVINLLDSGRISFRHIASEKKHYTEYKEIYQKVLFGDSDYVTTIIDWME